MSEKPLSERTKALYASTVAYMRKNYPELDLTDPEQVIEYLTILDKKPSTIRIALNSLIHYHKNSGLDLTKFKELYRKISDEIDAKERKQTKEGKEGKTLEWLKVLEASVKIQDDPTIPDMIKILVSFYTEMVPVRNDYANLKVYSTAPEKPDEGNYMVLNDTECFVQINNHKTAKKLGSLKRSLPAGLKTRVQNWLEENKTDVLFPLREARISKIMGDIFVKHSGQRATINTLRHSYISEFRKGDKALLEKESVAQAMGHTLRGQELYREL